MDVGQFLLLILLVLLLVLDSGLGIKIVQYSETRLVKKGENIVLFCRSDVKYDICSWNISGNLCKGSVDQGVAVKCQDRISLKPSLQQCELTIEKVAESDETKTYACSLIFIGTETPEYAKQSVKFEVARVASIDSSLRQEAEMIKILEGSSFTFTCASLGGKPEGSVRGFLGSWELPETDDGEYEFTATRGDCGKEVMCDMRQLDEKGNLYFPTVQNITRKIMVVFPPKYNDQYTKEYGYNEETGEPIHIQIRLESHPAPTASQVIWKIGNTSLHPDQALGEKFYAYPVEKQSDDWVVFALDVSSMEKADQDLQYSLEVRNDFSLAPLSLPFHLHFNAKVITTTTTTTLEPIVFSTVPSIIEAERMGSGSIAAIVLILIAILISLICIFWLKKNQRLCFKPYEEVPQKADQPDGKSSIIKTKTDTKQKQQQKDQV